MKPGDKVRPNASCRRLGLCKEGERGVVVDPSEAIVPIPHSCVLVRWEHPDYIESDGVIVVPTHLSMIELIPEGEE